MAHLGVAVFVGLPLLLALAPAARAEADAPQRIVESKFELFVSDVDASIRFYAVLGFEVAHRKPADGYTTLRAGPVVVALSPLPGWLPLHWLGFLRHPPLGTEIVFYTERLRELHAALGEAGHGPGEIATQPWGDTDFRVRDPDGYYVRVSEGRALPRGAGLAR